MATISIKQDRFHNRLATIAPGLSDGTIAQLIVKLTAGELDRLAEGLDQTRMHHLRQFCRQLNDASEPARLQVIKAYAESANF